MPYTVTIAPAALADLAAVRDWLTQEAGAQAADALIDTALERVDTLETFPARGALVPEFVRAGETNVRQLPVGPYRLMYEIEGEQVVVIAVVHVRRDLRSFLEGRLLRPPQS